MAKTARTRAKTAEWAKPKIAATVNTATMNKQAKKEIPLPTKKALKLTEMKSDTDVNGSYTGLPQNKKEMPVQDADDL